MSRLIGLLSLALGLHPMCAHARTQTESWTPAVDVGGLRYPGLVFDSWRGQLVCFGDSLDLRIATGVRVFDGGTWRVQHRATLQSPRINTGFGAAFDASRGTLLLLGGYPAGAQTTFEWSGSQWRSIRDASLPTGGKTGITYDGTRGGVLWVRGNRGQSSLLWTGSRWQPTGIAEPADLNGCLAVAAPSRRSVLVVGRTGNGALALYELAGNTWTRRAAPLSPPPSTEFATSWDPRRQRFVLFAGGRTQEWDGSSWSTASTTAPRDVMGIRMVDDPSTRTTVLVGFGLNRPLPGVTWRWNGSRWSEVFVGNRPLDRAQAHLLHDPVRGETYLFGGVDPVAQVTTPLNDLWRWTGSTWHSVSTTQRPLQRFDPAIALDSGRGRIVLFGGFFNFQFLNDTWEFDGTNWNQLQVTGPSPRSFGAMAYDSARGRCVMVGRAPGGGVETWEFDGTAWAQRRTNAPPAGEFEMDYDASRRRSVLFIGDRAETWEFDGTNWTRIQTPNTPPARRFFGLAYDGLRRAIVLHGGGDPNRSTQFDTWAYDGRDWTRLGNAASGSHLTPSIVFDTRRSSLLRVGSGTSRFGPTTEATDFGVGCGGATGVPRQSSGLPEFGVQRFLLEVRGARPNSPCVVVVSGSTTTGGPGPCRFYMGTPFVPLIAGNTSPAGFAHTAPIPLLSRGLLGAQFHTQALVLDPSSPTGFTATAGRIFRVGH